MTSERRRPPALRVRDVVPAGIGIVLLLGVAGCMGAYGGGPLGGDDGGTPEPTSTTEPVSPAPSPSFVVEPPDEGTPEYLGDFAEQLAESKKSGAAPDAFTNRKPLFSCGEFVLGQGATTPQEGWDCLAEHLETGAELVVVAPTVEGDPIMTYYRVGPEIDGMEYFSDPTFDTWGADEWEHMLCAIETDPLGMVNCVRADAA
ncbi:MAG: hypothetical protein GX593_03885 [Actinomycetales bacterium]|nr:hypothetical protein [Actinomycetales bacterium]